MRTQVVRVGPYGAICRLCGSKFSRYNDVRRHMKEKHLGSGVIFQCPRCQRTFTIRRSFQNHIRGNHPELKGLDVDGCLINQS